MPDIEKAACYPISPPFFRFCIMNRFFFILTSAILLTACRNEQSKTGNPPNQYLSVKDKLELPFDTTRVLALYNMPVREFVKNAPGDLDTFLLSNLMYACDCPSWANKKELKQIEEYNTLDLESKKQHDVFYLERGNPKLQLPEEFMVFGNKIRFYGKIRTRNGLPKNESFTDPDPPAGPVLTVYGYEVILPAFIYGPEVHVPDSTGKMPDWAQYEMSVLKVTKQNYFPRKD